MSNMTNKNKDDENSHPHMLTNHDLWEHLVTVLPDLHPALVVQLPEHKKRGEVKRIKGFLPTLA